MVCVKTFDPLEVRDDPSRLFEICDSPQPFSVAKTASKPTSNPETVIVVPIVTAYLCRKPPATSAGMFFSSVDLDTERNPLFIR